MRELTMSEMNVIAGGDRDTTVNISKRIGNIAGAWAGVEFGPVGMAAGTQIGEAVAEGLSGLAWDTLHHFNLV